MTEDGHFESGVYYPPLKVVDAEIVFKVKVEGIEQLDQILERVKAIHDYASCIPANIHINNYTTINKTSIDDVLKQFRTIPPSQTRLEV